MGDAGVTTRARFSLLESPARRAEDPDENGVRGQERWIRKISADLKKGRLPDTRESRLRACVKPERLDPKKIETDEENRTLLALA
jgi:hypothetical protein